MTKIVWGIIVVSLLFVSDLLGAGNARAMIVLDASGSMWGRAGGTIKINLLKKTLRKSLEESNPEAELGLTVFGHRKKKDCNDVEVMVPVGKDHKKPIIAAVMSIQPIGKAPISKALREAYDELAAGKNGKSAKIVLIADGSESCKNNPCTAAKELKRMKGDITIDVIAVGVDKKSAKQLSCIASETGGDYFPVKSAADLKKAIDTTIEYLKEEPPLPDTSKEALPETAAKKEKKEEESVPKQAAEEPMQISAGEKSTDAGKSLAAPKEKIVSNKESSKVITRPAKAAPKQQKRSSSGKISSATVEMSASIATGGNNVAALYYFYPLVADSNISRVKVIKCDSGHTLSCSKSLKAGQYLVKAVYKKYVTKRKFELQGGKNRKIHIVFLQRGEVDILASLKNSGKKIKAYHRVYRIINSTDRSAVITSCNSHEKRACVIKMRAGNYLIVSTDGYAKKETAFEIRQGKTTKLDIKFDKRVKSGQPDSKDSASTVKHSSAKTKKTGKSSGPKKRDTDSSKRDQGKKTEQPKVKHNIAKAGTDDQGGKKGNTTDSTARADEAKQSKSGDKISKVNDMVEKAAVLRVEKSTPGDRMQKGEVEITASEERGGSHIKAYHRIFRVLDGKADIAAQVSCNSYREKACIKELPAGSYLLKSVYNDIKKDTPFRIEGGKSVKVHVDIGQVGEVEISAGETEGEKQVEAYHRIYRVVNGKSGSRILVSCNSHKNEPCKEKLPAGKYLLKTSYNEIKKETPFEIKAGKTNKVFVVMGRTGEVEISASEQESGKSVKAYHRIYRRDHDTEGSAIVSCNSYDKKPCLEKLPAGKYTIKSVYSDIKKVTPFEIKAGKTTKVHINMGQTGKVEISAGKKYGGQGIEAFHNIYRAKNGIRYGDILISCNSNKKESCMERLPMGSYMIKSNSGKEKKETPFEIEAGKTTKVYVNFLPFHIAIKGINPCTMITNEVISSSGKNLLQERAFASRGLDLNLADGNYTIVSLVGDLSRKTRIAIKSTTYAKGAVIDFGGSEDKNSVEGVWNTSEGRATMHAYGKMIMGHYSSNDGELMGEMTFPQRFEGFWTEEHPEKKCTEAKNGRYFWGKLVWEFDDNMCSFKGKRGYCDEKPSMDWTGNYYQALPMELTREALKESNKNSGAASSPDRKKPTENGADHSTKPAAKKLSAQSENIQKRKLDKITQQLRELCKNIRKEDSEELRQQCGMLKMFSDVMNEKIPNDTKKDKKDQDQENKEADKEFKKMSKELKLYIK